MILTIFGNVIDGLSVLSDGKSNPMLLRLVLVILPISLLCASKITPVPGGVGPMTIACLLRNTVTSAYRHAGLGDPRGTVDSESHDQYKEKFINH